MAVQRTRARKELRAEAEQRARQLLQSLQPRRIVINKNSIVAEESRIADELDGVYAERVIYLEGGWYVVIRHYTAVRRLGKYVQEDYVEEYVRHGCGCTG